MILIIKEKVKIMVEYKVIKLQLPLDLDKQFSRIANSRYMNPEEFIIGFLQKYSVHPASMINYSEITEFAKYVKHGKREQEQQEQDSEHYIIREIKLPLYLYDKFESFLNLLNKTTKSYILNFIMLQIHSPNQDLRVDDVIQEFIREFREKSSKKQKDFHDYHDRDSKKDELTIDNPFF